MARRRTAGARRRHFDVVAIGSSWGGVEVLMTLVEALPKDWQVPIIIVQHQHPNAGSALERILGKVTALGVRDVEDKDRLAAGHVFIAPANYHLLVEDDGRFGLSIEAPVKYSRPSVDVTFASLARVYRQRCIGIILTGANDDGADGIRAIKAEGGLVLAQDPATAEAAAMPQAAIATGAVDAVLAPADIVPYLLNAVNNGTGNAEHSHR